MGIIYSKCHNGVIMVPRFADGRQDHMMCCSEYAMSHTIVTYDIICRTCDVECYIRHRMSNIRYRKLRHRISNDTIISKPGYYYDTIMTFGIFYLPYDTIMTLLLHLWLLQKFYYFDTSWQYPGKHYYYTSSGFLPTYDIVCQTYDIV